MVCEMTRKQMRISVLRKIDERIDNAGLETHFGEDEIDDMIEERYYYFMAAVLSRRPDLYARVTDGDSHPHLTVTGGSQLASLPSDYGGTVLSAELIIGGEVISPPLVYEPYGVLLKASNVLTGQPESFCFMGSNLFLWPSPSDSGFVRLAYNYVPDFPEDKDVDIEFPFGYEMVIPYQVVLDCAVKAGMSDGNKAVTKSELGRVESALYMFLARGRQSYNSSMRFRPKVRAV